MGIPRKLPIIGYLGGAMQGRTDYQAHNWRRDIIEAFEDDLNYNFISPMIRDYRGIPVTPGQATEIVMLDKRDIDISDFLVIKHDIPSVGTSMEQLYGWMQGKPIVLFNALPYEQNISPWATYHSTIITYSLPDTIDAIMKISPVLNYK